MSLKELFSQTRKRSASNQEDDDSENSQVESDTAITDSEPGTKHPRVDADMTESASTTSELTFCASSASAMKNKKYKQNMGYRPEYKRAHWWVRYDDSPGIEGMFCSVCAKWADIPKGNRVHQSWIKTPF